MTRSIFDPTNPNVEHGGNRFTPPDGQNGTELPGLFDNPPSSGPVGNIDFTPSPEKPAIDVSTDDDGKTLNIQITGTLHSYDYKHFVPIVENAVRKHGKVRMLVQMHQFHGWNAGALWQDMKFDLKHFNDIERLAIIGESTWEKWMATFCEPFTTATIRYFTPEMLADARAWLAAPKS